jgi:hypothetical protein
MREQVAKAAKLKLLESPGGSPLTFFQFTPVPESLAAFE